MKRSHLQQIARLWGRICLLSVMLLLGACSTKPVVEGNDGKAEEPLFPADRLLTSDVKSSMDIYDPWEGMNRSIYKFNAKFDQYVFLPVVIGYTVITPDVVEAGVTNFFRNFDDLRTLINQILQLKLEPALITTQRLIWNSTVGLFGVLNIADSFGLPRDKEDFGQTLGHYGAGPGPYMVVPVLGPSNLRDLTGTIADAFPTIFYDPLYIVESPYRELVYWVLRPIDLRKNTAFLYYETGSPYEYDLVRTLYNAKRRIEIEK